MQTLGTEKCLLLLLLNTVTVTPQYLVVCDTYDVISMQGFLTVLLLYSNCTDHCTVILWLHAFKIFAYD